MSGLDLPCCPRSLHSGGALWSDGKITMKNIACRLPDKLPDRNTEYLLYQTLVGAWPIEESRLLAYMEKAIREAKEHTFWTKPNKDYEKAIHNFIQSVMADKEFLADVESFVAPLILPGRVNGLAQTLIKLTAPGIPDIYQGSELWNMSLVDPDNRRDVDFAVRRDLLRQLKEMTPKQILDRMEEGLPKLWVTQQALHVRKRCPDLFGIGPLGSYQPLYALGSKSDHLVAFLRAGTAGSVVNVITAVPRFILKLQNDWGDTALELPSGTWRNIFTQEHLSGGKIMIKELLKNFPVALLERIQ